MAHAVTSAGTSPGRGQFNQQGYKVWHHFTLAFHKSAAELEAVVVEVGWCIGGQLSQSVGGGRPVLTFGDLVLTHPSPSILSPCPGCVSLFGCVRNKWFLMDFGGFTCAGQWHSACAPQNIIWVILVGADTRWGLGHSQGSTVRRWVAQGSLGSHIPTMVTP